MQIVFRAPLVLAFICGAVFSAAGQKMTPQQCSSGFGNAAKNLFECLAKIPSEAEIFRADTLSDLKGRYAYSCTDTQRLTPEDCQHMLELIGNQTLRDRDLSSLYKANMLRCMTTFDDAYRSLRSSCPGSTYGLFCATRKAVASSCGTYCENNCSCADWVPSLSTSPLCSAERTAFMPRDLMCTDAEDTAKLCVAGCPSGQSSCLQNCAGVRTQMIYACHGWQLPPKKKPSRYKPSTVDVGKKNNLDRFDLGPSYATPSTLNTGAGTRGAGAKGTGTKGTQSSDGVTSNKSPNPTLFIAPKP